MSAALRHLHVIAVPVAWLLALALVAAVAVTLFWRFTAPAPLALPVRFDADPRAVAQRIAGQQPFGGSAPAAAVAASPANTAAFTVVGVATGFIGGPGFALLKQGSGDPQAYVEGEEIARGLRLKRILADGVELEQGGRTERIQLPPVATTGIEPAPRPAGSPEPAAGPSARNKN
ncbi:MAG: alpha-1,2-mannosidase [Rhodocyclaceae bacterium]|nr:alpha-1,2-mannosidase [Rhodocyclaceae bacterium]